MSISYPFPMIVCCNKNYIYLLSINGELIKNEKLEEDQKVLFYVDKSFGLIGDSVEISNEKERNLNIFNWV